MNAPPRKAFSRTLFYSAAGPYVVTEVLDEELTLINLDTGQYYAAGGPAVDVWEIVAAGATAPDVEKILSSRYVAQMETITAEVMRLMGTYHDLGLISESHERTSPEHSAVEREAKAWEAGWIEVYGDMKELILLDPIHDVAAGGWPPAKAEKSS